ncbi:MAG: hypothetical protein QF524_01170 [Planctomycetota bacterium]|nr:hypothetical protein [Planctomycetota bacterium]
MLLLIPPDSILSGMADLDPEFLSILCCPLSHAALLQDGETLVSTDPATRRRYPITDGFPVLLIEEAEELSEEIWKTELESPPAPGLAQRTARWTRWTTPTNVAKTFGPRETRQQEYSADSQKFLAWGPVDETGGDSKVF